MHPERINNKEIQLSNKLANARYAMNVSEQKLFLYAIRNIDQSASEFPESKFSIKDFAKYADLDIKRMYKDIDKISTRLMQVIIYTESGDDKGWVKHNLTKTCRYDDGFITFEFNNDMEPLLLGLQEHYFKQAPEIFGFSSWYSFRIYDLLKSESYKNDYIVVEIDRLRTMLDINDKYPRFSNFRLRVVEPAIDQINEHSDLRVSCERVKKGRRVTALRFDVEVIGKLQKEYEDMLAGSYDVEFLKEAIGLTPKELTDVQIIELYETACLTYTNPQEDDWGDLYRYMRLNYEYTRRKKPTGNPYNYFKAALENDYAEATPQILYDYEIEY